MSADPLLIAERWLAATLTSDSALMALVAGVRRGRVPEGASWLSASGAPLIYVVFRAQSPGVDVGALGARRLLSAPLYQVKAKARTDSAAVIEPVVTRIDQLLHGHAGSVSGGSVLSCVREQPLSLDDIGPGGVTTLDRGGLYRLQVQEA